MPGSGELLQNAGKEGARARGGDNATRAGAKGGQGHAEVDAEKRKETAPAASHREGATRRAGRGRQVQAELDGPGRRRAANPETGPTRDQTTRHDHSPRK